ncbi:cytochrome P450 [uncultured Paracoccus sp.]|uniref:cytochrome P450 n=1 Tax=uncultured Paracoccus sp. TaxID=189685 RepID=UPI0026241688|nr:cytochrome P450 [uncultured Paracoccus sp.]
MISAIRNAVMTPLAVLTVWLEGVWGLLQVLALGAKTAMGGKAKLAETFKQPATQRKVFQVLRAFWPNLSLKKQLVKAYDNSGTVIVTRSDDCLDVLNRNEDFEVVYGSRMRKLTDGENFFLGMQPGWDYTRDTSAMRLAARRTDVAEIVLPRATELAGELVAASNGKLDLPAQLGLQVPWDMTDRYFGVGGPDAATMKEWTTILFWYLFEDLPADPDLDRRAMAAAKGMRDYLDGAIAARKASPSDTPDILNRCLALQSADTPGMSDLGIRNNLLGLLIGAIPTISKASCYAMDELLNRPDMLARAHQAAVAGDDALLANHIWEALRFTPHNPVIYRRAARDTVIARDTLREVKVAKGQMVFAATASAMFDRYAVEAPNEFRTDRRFETYIIWGYGMHTCFGGAINEAVIPAVLKPVLAQKNLRRAPGAAGRIDTGPTPHPQHFHVEFDR